MKAFGVYGFDVLYNSIPDFVEINTLHYQTFKVHNHIVLNRIHMLLINAAVQNQIKRNHSPSIAIFLKHSLLSLKLFRNLINVVSTFNKSCGFSFSSGLELGVSVKT